MLGEGGDGQCLGTDAKGGVRRVGGDEGRGGGAVPGAVARLDAGVPKGMWVVLRGLRWDDAPGVRGGVVDEEEEGGGEPGGGAVSPPLHNQLRL